MNRIWTEEKDRYLMDHSTQRAGETAVVLGVSVTAVRHRRGRLGIAGKQRPREGPATQKNCGRCGIPLTIHPYRERQRQQRRGKSHGMQLPRDIFLCNSCWRAWRGEHGLLPDHEVVPLIRRIRRKIKAIAVSASEAEGFIWGTANDLAAKAWGFQPNHLWELVRGWTRKDKTGKRLPIQCPSEGTINRLASAWHEDPGQLKKLIPQTNEDRHIEVTVKRNRRGLSDASISKRTATRAEHKEQIAANIRKGQAAYWDLVRKDAALHQKIHDHAIDILRQSRDRRTGRRIAGRGRTAFLCVIVREILRLRQRHFKVDPALVTNSVELSRQVAKDLRRKARAIKDPRVRKRYDRLSKDVRLLPVNHAQKCPECRSVVAFDLFSTGDTVRQVAQRLDVSVRTAHKEIERGRAMTVPLAYRVTTGQIARYSGVSIGAVATWADSGLLGFPDGLRLADRRGRRRTFDLRVVPHLSKYVGLSTGQAADRAGVTRKTIQDWCDDGRLDLVRTPNGTRRINPETLERLLSTRTQAATPR